MQKTALLLLLVMCSLSASTQDVDTAAKGYFFSYRERDEVDLEGLLRSVEGTSFAAVKGSATPVTAVQALARLRRLTEDSLPQDAPSDPATLRSAAAMALMVGTGRSQAFLLEAERIRPGEPQTRISMAGLLIVQGYPREAMALLGTTPPSDKLLLNGNRSIAAAWNLAKGVAHLALNEPKNAIPPLEKAVAQDGSLTEATQSLAKAQLMLGNRDAARQTLRQGAWRQRGHGRWSRDGRRGSMPYHKLYKLNNGHVRQLIDITPPLTARAYLDFLKFMEEQQKIAAEEQVKATAEMTKAAMDELAISIAPKNDAKGGMLTGAEKAAAADALQPLTNMMGIYPLNTQWDPGAPAAFNYLSTKTNYADDIEAISLRDHALSMKQNAMITQMLVYMDVIPRFNEATANALQNLQLPDDHEARCRKLIAFTEARLPQIYNNILPLDQAIREWYYTAWRLSSAISTHIPYGPLFKQTEATLESLTWQAETFRASDWMTAYAMLPSLDGCEAYMGPVKPVPPKTKEEEKLKACNDFTSGISLKFKIPKGTTGTLLEVGFSCEKVSIKGDLWNSGVLSVKGGLEYAPFKGAKGELTGLVGVAAEIPGGFGAEVDFYVTCDMSSGEVNDWGAKGSVEGNIEIDGFPGVDKPMETVLNIEQGGSIVHVENGEVKGPSGVLKTAYDAIIYVKGGVSM